jgi:hypothetical protein
MNDDEREVVLRRYDNALEAEMALEFVREHGVRARLQGSGTSAMLDRFTTVVDLRLVVPFDQRTAGQRALDAMEMDEDDVAASAQGREHRDPEGAPYRDRGASSSAESEDARDVRYRRGVIVGLVFPGGAHLYARQHTLGWLLFAAVVGAWFAGAVTGLRWLGLTGFLLVAFDLVHGAIAVRRHNERRGATARAQVAQGLIAAAAASLASFALLGSSVSPPTDALGRPLDAPAPAR